MLARNALLVWDNRKSRQEKRLFMPAEKGEWVISPSSPTIHQHHSNSEKATEKIRIQSKDASRSVSIDTVEGIAKTKSLIVLFIQGLMTVTMRKDGFFGRYVGGVSDLSEAKDEKEIMI